MTELVFEKLKKTTLILGGYSFIGGTLILFSFLLTGISDIQIIGFIYNLTACIINGLFFGILLVLIVIYPRHYWKLIQLMLVLLLNVPVALLYLYIATEFKS